MEQEKTFKKFCAALYAFVDENYEIEITAKEEFLTKFTRVRFINKIESHEPLFYDTEQAEELAFDKLKSSVIEFLVKKYMEEKTDYKILYEMEEYNLRRKSNAMDTIINTVKSQY